MPFSNLEKQRAAYNAHMMFACGVDPNIGINCVEAAFREIYKGKSLLEIGCGNGRFAFTMLYEYDFDTATLIDLSDVSIEYACKTLAGVNNRYGVKLNATIIRTSLEEFAPREKFDMVAFWEGLEHVIDLDLALSKISECLRSDGHFIGSVPDGHTCDHESHLHYFNRQTLNTLLSRYFSNVNIKRIDITGTSEWHFAFSVCDNTEG